MALSNRQKIVLRAIKDGPKSAAQVAGATGVSKATSKMLLDACVGSGHASHSSGDRYAITQKGKDEL